MATQWEHNGNMFLTVATQWFSQLHFWQHSGDKFVSVLSIGNTVATWRGNGNTVDFVNKQWWHSGNQLLPPTRQWQHSGLRVWAVATQWFVFLNSGDTVTSNIYLQLDSGNTVASTLSSGNTVVLLNMIFLQVDSGKTMSTTNIQWQHSGDIADVIYGDVTSCLLFLLINKKWSIWLQSNIFQNLTN